MEKKNNNNNNLCSVSFYNFVLAYKLFLKTLVTNRRNRRVIFNSIDLFLLVDLISCTHCRFVLLKINCHEIILQNNYSFVLNWYQNVILVETIM